jgi:hypothetical protein
LSIRLYILFWFVFYEVIQVSWLESLVWQVSHVDLGYFFSYFNYFFQFYFLKLSWLRILIYNFFQFAFYRVILVFLVWLVDSVIVFCLFYYFFQFNLLKLGWLRIEIYIFLLFTFYAVIIVLWPDRGLDRLTQVFCPF